MFEFWHMDHFWHKWTMYEQPVETAVLAAWHSKRWKDSESVHVVTPKMGSYEELEDAHEGISVLWLLHKVFF